MKKNKEKINNVKKLWTNQKDFVKEIDFLLNIFLTSTNIV